MPLFVVVCCNVELGILQGMAGVCKQRKTLRDRMAGRIEGSISIGSCRSAEEKAALPACLRRVLMRAICPSIAVEAPAYNLQLRIGCASLATEVEQ